MGGPVSVAKLITNQTNPRREPMSGGGASCAEHGGTSDRNAPARNVSVHLSST